MYVSINSKQTQKDDREKLTYAQCGGASVSDCGIHVVKEADRERER